MDGVAAVEIMRNLHIISGTQPAIRVSIKEYASGLCPMRARSSASTRSTVVTRSETLSAGNTSLTMRYPSCLNLRVSSSVRGCSKQDESIGPGSKE